MQICLLHIDLYNVNNLYDVIIIHIFAHILQIKWITQ